jgi:hypothetical protein
MGESTLKQKLNIERVAKDILVTFWIKPNSLWIN